MLEHERIRITTAGDEFHATALRPKFGTFSRRKLAVREVKPRLTIRVGSLNTHYRRTLFKNQLIRLRPPLGEEAVGITIPQVKIATNR